MPALKGQSFPLFVKEVERVSTLDLAAYEVGSAVWRRVRRGELSMEEGNVVVSTLLSLLETFEVFSYREVAADAFRLAVDAGITVYDAAYVVLAKRLDARLLTLDGELLRKFPDVTYAPQRGLL
ncbi:MAG: type II toxin-antitoxin system VapC family toxin [Pyrobaculum sp.]